MEAPYFSDRNFELDTHVNIYMLEMTCIVNVKPN